MKNHREKKKIRSGPSPPTPFPFSPCLLDIGRQVFNSIHFRCNVASFHSSVSFYWKTRRTSFWKLFLFLLSVVASDLSTCSLIDRVSKSVIRVKKKKSFNTTFQACSHQWFLVNHAWFICVFPVCRNDQLSNFYSQLAGFKRSSCFLTPPVLSFYVSQAEWMQQDMCWALPLDLDIQYLFYHWIYQLWLLFYLRFSEFVSVKNLWIWNLELIFFYLILTVSTM